MVPRSKVWVLVHIMRQVYGELSSYSNSVASELTNFSRVVPRSDEEAEKPFGRMQQQHGWRYSRMVKAGLCSFWTLHNLIRFFYSTNTPILEAVSIKYWSALKLCCLMLRVVDLEYNPLWGTERCLIRDHMHKCRPSGLQSSRYPHGVPKS
jgi:hypothetical protein